MASNAPTGIGMMVCCLIGASGFVIGLVQRDVAQVFGGALARVTCFGACAVQGTAMEYLWDKLRTSPDFYDAIMRASLLKPADGTANSRAG